MNILYNQQYKYKYFIISNMQLSIPEQYINNDSLSNCRDASLIH